MNARALATFLDRVVRRDDVAVGIKTCGRTWDVR